MGVRFKGLNGKLIFAIAAAAVGSAFQHGYNTGVLNNPEDVLNNWLRDVLTDRNNGVKPDNTRVTLLWAIIVSIYCVGGMIGGLVTGFIAEKFGRKGGLLFNNVFIIIAGICMACAKSAASYELMVFARFLIGINSGLNAGLTPMYLAEISPVNLRGAVGSVYQLVITISILLAQILSHKALLGTAELWPVLLAFIIVPALGQLVTLPFCSESPKFLLISKGKVMEAERALTWLRCSNDVHDEVEQMKSEAEAIKLMPKITLRDLIVNGALRAPLIISLMVMCAQQFSGINAVMFYSTNIFTMAGLSQTGATGATMTMGLVNVVMTFVSMILVEKAGRKTLLLVGFAGTLVFTILLTFSIFFAASSIVVSYFCIICVLMYVVMFATGPGSIPWFLVSELFSQSARPTAASLAVFVNWFANFIVGLTFLPIKEMIGPYVFVVYIIMQALFLVFIYKKVPETKNKSIEEISALFRQKSYE